MQQAAIAICAHSGWGALVAIAGFPDALQVLERKKIVVTDPSQPGAKQPYHFAGQLPLSDAEHHITACAAASERLALAALSDIMAQLRRNHTVAACAVLLASGRPLPALPEILKSHSLIHTAEGEFFRQSFWKAAEHIDLEVTGIRERDLEHHAKKTFQKGAARVIRTIADLGKSVGPPWTADQKNASLAALLLLAAWNESISA